MSKPIRPSDIASIKQDIIPAAVFDAYNELIAMNYNGGSALVYQADVVALIKEKMNLPDGTFQAAWLNVEDVYEEAGWKVSYDSPGYNESYKAHFIFRGKSK